MGKLTKLIPKEKVNTAKALRQGETTWFFSSCDGIVDLRRGIQASSCVGPGNCMDLTEAEDIKKRWQEYTEELYKKDLHDPDNHDGKITHLEPDILECEVK